MLAIFYWTVVQAILLYGLETWLLSSSIEKRVEGTHKEFLRLITGKQARRITRQEMGYAGAARRTRDSRNPVNEDLHIETAGNHGAVGGSTSLI